jgi:NAD(P)-dependent dehydrogenase (short-subunit alcohol dehydrogenase family)
MTSSTLSDKVILVTGAANGIGAAVAEAYAAQGATIVLLDKDVSGLEKTYDAIAASSVQAAIYPLDLKGAGIDDYADLVKSIKSHFDRLDGLVHCAAMLGQLAPLEHQDPVIWSETLHVNLTAPFLLTKACLPLLKKQQQGAIIFTTDDHQGKAYWAGYGISKAGIEALAKQLADELETEGRIGVHCIEPGQVQTALFSRAFPAITPHHLPHPDEAVSPYLNAMVNTLTTR